jgi:ankyrin repeat protein
MKTAILKADIKQVTELVQDKFPLNKRIFDGENRTALHVAVAEKRHRIIELLLNAGADPDIKTDQFKETALHEACNNGDERAVALLIAGGASVHIEDKYDTTPVMTAASASKNAGKMLSVLIAAGGSVKPNKLGRNPLHDATRQDDVAVINQLIDAGADVNGQYHGMTPLMESMENFFICKADPKQRAYNKPRPQIVESLIKHGADPTMVFPREIRGGDDAEGKSIIEYAVEMDLPKAVLQLLAKGKSKPTGKPTGQPVKKKSVKPKAVSATKSKGTKVILKAVKKIAVKKVIAKKKTKTAKKRK